MSGENPLHRARLEHGIDLTEVGRRTCLSPQVVRKIDEGRFDELPAGVYARSYVRAFATAVALEPESAIASVAQRLPPAEDPLPVLRDAATRSTVSRLQPLALLVRSGMARMVPRWTGVLPDGPHRLETCTDALARIQPWLSSGRRVAAVCVDAAALVLLHGLLVQLTAWTAGVANWDVLASAGTAVTMVWALLVVQYFVLFGGIGGRTPGAWAFGLGRMSMQHRPERLGLRAILHRAMLY